jgi:hypothetical protein
MTFTPWLHFCCVLGILLLNANTVDALQSDVGILDLSFPLPDYVVSDTFALSFSANLSPHTLPDDVDRAKSSVLIMWDDSVSEKVSFDSCPAADMCDFAVPVTPLGGQGPHILTLMLIHEWEPDGSSPDTIDQLQLELHFAPAQAAPADPSPPASAAPAWQIRILSPRNLSSFLDPNNVTIAFEWLPPAPPAAAAAA